MDSGVKKRGRPPKTQKPCPESEQNNTIPAAAASAINLDAPPAINTSISMLLSASTLETLKNLNQFSTPTMQKQQQKEESAKYDPTSPNFYPPPRSPSFAPVGSFGPPPSPSSSFATNNNENYPRSPSFAPPPASSFVGLHNFFNDQFQEDDDNKNKEKEKEKRFVPTSPSLASYTSYGLDPKFPSENLFFSPKSPPNSPPPAKKRTFAVPPPSLSDIQALSHHELAQKQPQQKPQQQQQQQPLQHHQFGAIHPDRLAQINGKSSFQSFDPPQQKSFSSSYNNPKPYENRQANYDNRRNINNNTYPQHERNEKSFTPTQYYPSVKTDSVKTDVVKLEATKTDPALLSFTNHNNNNNYNNNYNNNNKKWPPGQSFKERIEKLEESEGLLKNEIIALRGELESVKCRLAMAEKKK